MYEEHHAPLEHEQQTRIINGVGGVWSMSKQIGHVDKIKRVTVVSPNKFGALQTDDEDDVECELCVPPGLNKHQRMPAVKGRKS